MIRTAAQRVAKAQSEETPYVCPACRGLDVWAFHYIENVPVHSVMNVPTRCEAEQFTLGAIDLAYCKECGFIANHAFDDSLLRYGSGYEATQSFSATFKSFARRLAERLIERYDLHNKTLLEIGCGNGEFLALMCELGENRGIGFDPAYDEQRTEGLTTQPITIIKDFYSEKYAQHRADFLFCRMTLEHIPKVAEFVEMVRRSMAESNGTIVFFQVPDVTRILSECAFEDIYYEHCSYFSPGSLGRLFERCGFEVMSSQTDFDGQYTMIEARISSGYSSNRFCTANDLEKTHAHVAAFARTYSRKKAEWQHRLDSFAQQNKRVVLWGAGSKAVAFLSTMHSHRCVEYAVDINPYRQGMFMPGSGKRIVPPSFMKRYRPDVVITMNKVYQQEIGRSFEEMGLAPQLLTL